MQERAIPILGLLVMLAIAWGLSSRRDRFPWRVVIGGLGLQIVLALTVLQIPAGKAVFESIGGVITNLLNCVDQGAGFVFGDTLVQTARGPTPAYQVSFVAFKVLPTIIFFSSLMSILYYLGVMQWVVGGISRLMQKTLGTSGAETLSAAGNIFVGQTEAPLLIRPYLNTMTNSELMAVMVGGFATIAGGVMAAYVGMGISPVHLLSASLMSAPAALVIAKIMGSQRWIVSGLECRRNDYCISRAPVHDRWSGGIHLQVDQSRMEYHLHQNHGVSFLPIRMADGH
jgi:concentrative nucleoside transporter, CNT family